MQKFLSPTARRIEPYEPGEQPKDGRLIKLNTNENPYPPSPLAQQALRNVAGESLRLYSLPEHEPLREAIAQVEGLPGIDWVYAGNGSDEVLALAFYAFFGGELPLVTPDIGYSFYPVYCDLYAIEHAPVALREDFSLDVQALCAAPCCGVAFANPNAPTGLYTPLPDVERILQAHPERVVLVDEAYMPFGNPSAVSLLGRYPNLAVIRTLSKSHALAGLRCGYILAQPHLIEGYKRVKNSFNSYPLGLPVQSAARAAILDTTHAADICNRVVRTRQWVKAQLSELGFTFPDSGSNFLLITHPRLTGEQLYTRLRAHGVLVRYFAQPQRLANCVRMTIGTDQQMRTVMGILHTLLV